MERNAPLFGGKIPKLRRGNGEPGVRDVTGADGSDEFYSDEDFRSAWSVNGARFRTVESVVVTNFVLLS